jgi:thymidylate kinase
MTDTHPLTFAVAVLGIDGSGKSTLAGALARHYAARARVVLIGDRAEVFDGDHVTDLHAQLTEHMRRRIADHAKSAKSLASYKVPKIADLVLRDRLLDEVAREYRPRVVVLDGMPALNMAAWTILYHAESLDESTCLGVLAALTGRGDVDPGVYARFPELSRLRELGYAHMHVPDATVFLDVAPEVCVTRIDARGKPRQPHETTEALALLRKAYLLVCATLVREWNARVFVVEGDRDAGVVTDEAAAFVDNVRRVRE